VSLVSNNPFGVGIELTSCKEIADLGGKCVAKLRYHMHKNDYRPIVQTLKRHLKKGQAVLFSGYGTEARLILRQAYQMGIQDKSNWYSDFPTMWSNEIAEMTKVGTGIKGLSLRGKSSIYKDVYAIPYKKQFGTKPTTAFGGFAYDSAMLAALAVQKAGSNDPTAIAKALHEVSRNYLGVTGDVTFDQDGMRKTATYAKKIFKDGKLQHYQTESGPLTLGYD